MMSDIVSTNVFVNDYERTFKWGCCYKQFMNDSTVKHFL